MNGAGENARDERGGRGEVISEVRGGRGDGVWVGTAGWGVPVRFAGEFAGEGSHLQRYAGRLRCAEVNSTFTRVHRRATWERWAASVPEGFRFAVKGPKSVTHNAKLERCGGLLQGFFGEVGVLGERLGPVLFQLPPKLGFEEGVVREFLATVRELHGGLVAMEPRHASWFEAGVGALLREFGVARVAADPAKGGVAAGVPGGWAGLVYRRMHGSPRVYYTGYSGEFLGGVAEAVRRERERGAEVWCVFDNTAAGEGAGNALELEGMLR